MSFTNSYSSARVSIKPAQTDNVLVAADYSQIELRILAHMSKDSVLTESFRNNEDIHRRTASEVFGVAMEDVTKEMRRNAKAVNLSIFSGTSKFTACSMHSRRITIRPAISCGGTSKINSSCTCSSIFASKLRFFSCSCTCSMAILIISAAVP